MTCEWKKLKILRQKKEQLIIDQALQTFTGAIAWNRIPGRIQSWWPEFLQILCTSLDQISGSDIYVHYGWVFRFSLKYWVFLLYQFLCLDFVIICFIFISVCVFNCDLISIDLISLFAFLSFPSVGFPVYAARFYFQPFGVLFLWKRRSKKQLGGETARHQTQNVHKYITVHASAKIHYSKCKCTIQIQCTCKCTNTNTLHASAQLHKNWYNPIYCMEQHSTSAQDVHNCTNTLDFIM